MISRRNIVILAAAAPLGACAVTGGSTDSTISKVADYVSTVAGSLLDVVQQLGTTTIPGLTQDALQKANFAIAAIQSLAQQVKSAADTVAQQPLVQKIVSYANAVFDALQPVLTAVGLGTVADILKSVQVVLPIIMSLVGLVVPAAATARSARVTATSSIDSNQAWIILRAHQAKP